MKPARDIKRKQSLKKKKNWVEAGPGEKCEKVTLKPEKEALEQP